MNLLKRARDAVTYTTTASKRFLFGDTTITITTINTNNLIQWANDAITNANDSNHDSPATLDPNTNNNTANHISIAIATYFLARAAPSFLTSSLSNDQDRMVKVGRSIVDLVELFGKDGGDKGAELKTSLEGIVEECTILASDDLKVPKVRFGKTNIQMPIVTLGCMRFQQSWADVDKIDNIKPSCQDNLVQILQHAVQTLGINHIETARMYGCSELQLADAFQNLFATTTVTRGDLIIQTKVNPMPAKDFRKTLEDSFRVLKLEYIDLFSFHGVNMDHMYDLIFDNGEEENLIDIIREYQREGKIRHVGFSTHGRAELITRLIETDAFDYVNLHYHAFESYTASGDGKFGGNLQNVRLMKEKDMGVFVISPYDKGGRVYAPSKKLRSLTLPDLEPIRYGSLWLWNHENHDAEHAPIHTIVCGAARPSDLDQPAIAAYLHGTRTDEMTEKVATVAKRLHDAEVEALGDDWVNTWWEGVPNCSTEKDSYQFGQILSLYNMIKAWGMLDYAKDRYGAFDDNLAKWDFDLPTNQNIENNGRMMWGYMPGIATEQDKDYSHLFPDISEEKKAKVTEAIEFTRKHCSKTSDKSGLIIPTEWETAYDMRPWTEFPLQK